MKAFQLTAHGCPGTYRFGEIADPQPGPGEVVVRVGACGVNHLDLWAEKGALPVAMTLPRTLGCEIAGRVEAWDAAVQGWERGERVSVQSNIFCGRCEYCRRGEESMCLQSVMLGVQADGGFAERVAVPARALVRLPDNLEEESAAALSLAGSTAMHMLTDRARVQAGDWVLVMAGASGVGSAAIQIARQLGGRVISTGSTEAKRRLARHLGAEEVLDLGQDGWPGEVRRITGKRGVDLVVEHLGGAILAQVFQCLARGGTVVTCGATTGREVALDLWPFFVKQQRLAGSYGRNRTDLEETLAWAASGRLKPVVDSVHALSVAHLALDRLRSRSALGKVIVRPG